MKKFEKNKKKKINKDVELARYGIPKWIKEYRERFTIDLNQLERKSLEFLALDQSKANNRSEDKNNSNGNVNQDDDDGGWTVVSNTLKKTRQRMIPSTEKALNHLRMKHKRSSEKKELINFYKFQMTNKKLDQLEQLKMKFELDKQRIIQMRQQRKFKPF